MPTLTETLHKHQLWKASPKHIVWNSSDGQTCHWFSIPPSMPGRARGWTVQGPCCKPTGTLHGWVWTHTTDGQAANQDLTAHAGEKLNRRLCQSHQFFDSNAWIAGAMDPGHKTRWQTSDIEVIHLIIKRNTGLTVQVKHQERRCPPLHCTWCEKPVTHTADKQFCQVPLL